MTAKKWLRPCLEILLTMTAALMLAGCRGPASSGNLANNAAADPFANRHRLAANAPPDLLQAEPVPLPPVMPAAQSLVHLPSTVGSAVVPASATGNFDPPAAANPAAFGAEANTLATTLAHQEQSHPRPLESVGEFNDPFAGQPELQLPQVVDEVLARNQSLQAMVAAWRVAAQRYPQAVSLEDPMFAFMLGPGSWGSTEVDSAYMVEGSQRIPWPGKRALRGRVASAEATAAKFDAADASVRLVEVAKQAYFDYFLVRRWRDLNDENLRKLHDFREAAAQKYRASLVTQQDVLQADVELAAMQRRNFELQRMERVAIARINTLMHRPPDVPLPPPPERLDPPTDPPPPELLLQVALQQRPDLAALGARVRAEQANWQLACKEYLPDFDVIGRYDAFWQEEPLRPMVGANMNVPLYRAKRDAAVREAMYRVNQRRAEYDQQVDDIRNDLQAAYAQLVESRNVVQLYDATILPAARQNIDLARSGYIARTVDFLRLIEAQRQSIKLQEESFEAAVDYHRRLAELERIVAGPVPLLAPPPIKSQPETPPEEVPLASPLQQ